MKVFTRNLLVVAALAVAIAPAAGQAVMITSYDFEAGSLDNPTTEAANTDSSAMTGASWTSGGSASFGRSSAGNYYGRGPSDTAGTSWVGFTITADPGYTLDLDQLAFDYYVQQRTSGTWFTFEARSSVDGFANAIAGTYSENPTQVDSTYESATLDLSGGSYDGLGSITFHLHATSDATPHFNDIMRWDNIEVRGDVVPEPATMALLGLGGMALLRRRRK